MADEVYVSFLLPGEPAPHIAQWRATPPPFLGDYKRIDESYESLVYESNVTTTFTKLATFGMGKTLFRPMALPPARGTNAAGYARCVVDSTDV